MQNAGTHMHMCTKEGTADAKEGNYFILMAK